MQRWLYAYRQVRGASDELSERLRTGLEDALAESPYSPAADGSFPARLHVDVGSLGATKRVRMRVGVASEHGTRLRIPLEWEAEPARVVFPGFAGSVEFEPMDAERAQLTVVGSYRVPLGPLGAAVDAGLRHAAAQDAVEELVDRIASAISDLEASRPPVRDRCALTVSDVMSHEPVTLEEDMPLRTGALLLFHYGIAGAPVLAADGALVGVLSEADLLHVEAPRPRASRRSADARTPPVGLRRRA